MSMVLTGASVAATRKQAILARANSLRQNGTIPCLGILLVGDDAASHVYSQRLCKLGAAVGVTVLLERLPQYATESEVLSVIDRWNSDPAVHSILPMMPMPRHISAANIAERLLPLKDADSLSPINAGLVASGKSDWAPCTPRAVLAILQHYQIPLAGKQAVVIGRSNVVGKPLAHLLLAADATVTICHSKSNNLAEIVKQGDIVIAAVGRPEMINAAMIKPGAVIVDVGINETEHGLVGDVDFAGVQQVAAAITPVPGGVGTVSSVMVMEAVVNRWLGTADA